MYYFLNDVLLKRFLLRVWRHVTAWGVMLCVVVMGAGVLHTPAWAATAIASPTSTTAAVDPAAVESTVMTAPADLEPMQAQLKKITLQNENMAAQIKVLQKERSAEIFIFGAMALLTGILLGVAMTQMVGRKRGKR